MRIILMAALVVLGILSNVLFRNAGVSVGTWAAAGGVVLGVGALLNALFLKLGRLQPGKMGGGERPLGLLFIGAGAIAAFVPRAFPDLPSSFVTEFLIILGAISFIVGLTVEATARKKRQTS
jgi:hypothetical protein